MNSSLPIIQGHVATALHVAQDYVVANPIRCAVLAVLYSPIIAIILNVLRQIVIPKDPSLPPEVFHWLPIVGSAIQYGSDPLNFFFKCREKYGDVFTFVLLGRKITVALGNKGNNFVLGGKHTSFSAEDAYTHLTTPVFGKDVVYDVPNEVFMEQKKFVKFGLSADNLRSYVGMIEDEVEEFMKNDGSFLIYQMNDINEWGRFDVTEAMSGLTILTASRTLQGKEVRDGLNKSFSELYNDLDGGFTPLNFMFPNLPLESYRRRDRAHAKMSQFYVDIINKRREGNSDTDHDMIAALMDQKYRDGRSLRDHEIAHIMIALLMAGQHTSSATSSWALLHIAHDQAVQKALYEEQVKYFGAGEGKFRPLTHEELRQLPILDSVIRETLRMHPPLHSLMRKVREDVPVPPTLSAPSKDGTYVVPKGHFVLSSAYVSQMDPLVWSKPNDFNAARWSEPDGAAAEAFRVYSDETGEKVDYGFGAVSKGTESPYQPFGAGRHRCIGEQFAYLQLGTVISTIIRKVELRLESDKVPDHNYHTMIVMPKKPRNICYRRRNFN
ncbi:lanosterol 14-alpha-demethylase [Coniophora puteana RWD-64-598 SS2]|uniref:Lanosterol 14-alpha-demethylase n=1 Tax=Coniophora puteana (strain RWD-64-598) TaxID=741705 RepID=A0A5M3MYY1_CONPW|nr:lanosterol 14-alpha-demethylase [Coniophora puteana RWD-64-598 SS2]EIW84237.1 lanosterol 14-alpha-demethylase [Coniophora puteana RWD-64-598 SS2]